MATLPLPVRLQSQALDLAPFCSLDALSDVLPRRSDVILMKVAEALDPARLYVVHSLKDSLSTFVGREAWFSTLYSDKP